MRKLIIMPALSMLLVSTNFSYAQAPASVQDEPIEVTDKAGTGKFVLASKGKASPVITDPTDAEVTQIAAVALCKDIYMITGIRPVASHAATAGSCPVIIGTLNKSAWIDRLAREGKIPAGQVKDKWETFCMALVSSPADSITQALVIFGSDPRGTAFGVFQLSQMMGVSPFVWWADVSPQPRAALYITGNKSIIGPPSVKFRGIFINDEDWGLQPWAAQNMDTDIKDIGPKTYERVFELMLRLKANYLWPAMHPCTKAFWFYKQNPLMARKYDIVLGASHCEPMLRNNIFEWSDNFKNEYGEMPGPWRYDSNSYQIDHYWADRVKEAKSNDAVYTVGMRGIHDGSMPGPKSKKDKVKLLEEIIRNQRKILSDSLDKPASNIPQIFCPYKEVLDLYRMNMVLPEDVTLAWADDNYGYIRQLSNPEEQKRTGGSGVYYHFSYWGWPKDYLWLSSISPMLASYELTKAYQLNAHRLWVFNVGDIKPAEMELQFAMDLAWDINAWTPEKAYLYPAYWAAATFGNEFGQAIGHIKSAYYRLAAAGKPEHLDDISFTAVEAAQRLKDYQVIVREARIVAARIPARLKDAYFELITYPVEASCRMNEKILYARQSLQLATMGNKEALVYAKKAQAAYDDIQLLTLKYNTSIANGKWKGIMSCTPRNLDVFKMPKVATPEMINAGTEKSPTESSNGSFEIPASHYSATGNGKSLQIIEGLGVGKYGLTVWPMTLPSFNEQNILQAPYAVYKISVKAGHNNIYVKCLPDFPLYNGLRLRYAISIDGATPVFVDVTTLAETKLWATNILKGYAVGKTSFQSKDAGQKTIRIYFPDPGLVASSIGVE